VNSSAPGGSFFPRLQIKWNSAFTSGLINLLMTTLLLRQTGSPSEGIMATPSSASTKRELCVQEIDHDTALPSDTCIRQMLVDELLVRIIWR
jgi:hypothetical protein